MTGCDRCGAQARAGESVCPVCGLALAARGRREAPPIPVRRHGTVPPPPREVFDPVPERRPISRAALALGALGAALIAAGFVFWVW